jgi:hypothetical protein
VARGPRHLDHGVLLAGVAAGTPHLYRLQLGLGLLDHITIGATAHWLASQKVPGWSPTGAIAFYRSRRLEVGATYHQTLHPPPKLDEDPTTPSFEKSTHWFLAAVTLSQSWLSAGFDLGMARARSLDELAGDDAMYRIHNRLAGGVHFRVGTRRFGLTLQALAPYFEVEAMLDVRFGLFEQRPRGGWLTY